jgi:hypothetical protein
VSDLTLQELAAETLTQKHRRLTQAKCRHGDVYWSSVTCDRGTFTNGFCWDCGWRFHREEPAAQISSQE